MIFRTQMAWEFNYMYGETWTIMYNKNVKKLLKYSVVKDFFNGPVYPFFFLSKDSTVYNDKITLTIIDYVIYMSGSNTFCKRGSNSILLVDERI